LTIASAGCRRSRRFVFPVKKISQTAEQKNFDHPESTAAHTAAHTTEAAGAGQARKQHGT
jgi:hypothetical protein